MLFPLVKEQSRALGHLMGFISSDSDDSDTANTEDDDAPPTTDAYMEDNYRHSDDCKSKGSAQIW